LNLSFEQSTVLLNLLRIPILRRRVAAVSLKQWNGGTQSQQTSVRLMDPNTHAADRAFKFIQIYLHFNRSMKTKSASHNKIMKYNNAKACRINHVPIESAARGGNRTLPRRRID
jgi:hypothetical protein